MTALEFKDRMVEGLEAPVYHILAAPEDECPVVCWQELIQSELFGDDKPVFEVVSVQIDYFTTDEYDIYPATIESFLVDEGVLFTRNAFTFDEDRGEWRTIWTVQFLGG